MNNKIGERIRKERELAGLSQKELAKKAGFKNYQTLLKIERGERRITIQDISVISRALNLYADYFICTEQRPAYPVLWKGMTSRKACRVHENKLTKYTDNYFHLNEVLGIKVNSFHPYSPREFTSRYATYLSGNRFKLIAKLAEDFIKEFNLGDYPADSLLRAITEKGIIVFSFRMDNSGSAACYVSQKGASILLNKEESPWSAYYNIAHELYHIITWGITDFKMHNYSLVADDIEERLADSFASSLLIPETTLRSEIGRLEEDDDLDEMFVSTLAVKFRVHADVLLDRMTDLGIIDAKKRAKMNNDKLNMIFRKNFLHDCISSADLNHDEEYGISYFMLAYSAWAKGRLTKMKMADYLNKNIGEIDFFLQQNGLEIEQRES